MNMSPQEELDRLEQDLVASITRIRNANKKIEALKERTDSRIEGAVRLLERVLEDVRAWKGRDFLTPLPTVASMCTKREAP